MSVNLRDEFNESNYAMIRKYRATINNFNDKLIILHRFASQFFVHTCN